LAEEIGELENWRLEIGEWKVGLDTAFGLRLDKLDATLDQRLADEIGELENLRLATDEHGLGERLAG
jgi:hypothetical protein